jgi:hypothetical protein
VIDKKALVSSLPVSDDELRQQEDVATDQMSLARSLLKLADIDQEKEFQLCHSLATRLLEKVPEPEEVDLD